MSRDQRAFKEGQSPKPNIDKEDRKALKQLSEDETRVILTTDKKVVMVVMDKKDYVEKAEELLGQHQTYKPSLQILLPDRGTD